MASAVKKLWVNVYHDGLYSHIIHGGLYSYIIKLWVNVYHGVQNWPARPVLWRTAGQL